MEKYIINGVEVEYDTFDLDNMERLAEATGAVQDSVKGIQARMRDGENVMGLLREQANVILDFFDEILGDGSADKIFGGKVNIRDLTNGYKEFNSAVVEKQSELATGITGMNREQRRAQRRVK